VLWRFTVDTVGMDETSVLPDLPAEVREAARQAGGGWIDEVVGNHTPPVPASAIKGSWKIDANGDLTGEFVANPEYGRRRVRCPYSGKSS
jgi:hypothetical protein